MTCVKLALLTFTLYQASFSQENEEVKKSKIFLLETANSGWKRQVNENSKFSTHELTITESLCPVNSNCVTNRKSEHDLNYQC